MPSARHRRDPGAPHPTPCLPRAQWALLSPPALLGAFLLVTSTTDLVAGVGEYDEKRLLGLFVFAALMALALVLAPLRRAAASQIAHVPPWIGAALGAAGLLAALSALRFDRVGYGLAEPALLGLVAVGALIVAASRRAAPGAFDRLAMLVLAALGGLVAFQEAIGILANLMLGQEYSFNKMLARFSFPRFYNHLQTWSIPVVAALPFVFGGTRRLRAVAVALLALQWCILLVSGARGSTVSILAALALTAWLAPGGRARWLRLHAGGLVAGCLLYGALLAGQAQLAPRGGEFLQQSVGRSMLHSSGRTYMWDRAWSEAIAAPWLGVGPARYQCEASRGMLASPHNLPLQLLAEWGIPAALLVLAVAGWLGWRLIRHMQAMPRRPAGPPPLLAMLCASALAAALHLNLSGLLIVPSSQVMATLMAGWLLGWMPFRPQPESPRAWPGAALPAAGLAVALALAAFATVELRSMRDHEAGGGSNGPPWPRFWQHGRVCLYSHGPGQP